jgi:hypothetical protein
VLVDADRGHLGHHDDHHCRLLDVLEDVLDGMAENGLFATRRTLAPSTTRSA